MNSLPVVIVAMLWVIAIGATVAIVKESGAFTFLGPVYFICMMGCIVTVRRASSKLGD
jgi:hypothetical protein